MDPAELRPLVRVALAALALRALALLAYLLASSRTSIAGYSGTVPVKEAQTRSERLGEIDRDLFERLAPFDGQFYLDIAREGYRRYEVWPGGNYAFLPLYPLLLYALGGAGRWSVLAAAVLQILLCAGTAVGLWLLAARLHIRPWGPVALFLAWPTSVFQVVAYPESLFVFLSVFAALFRAWGCERSMAVSGFLAGMTRTQGILVSFLLLPSASIAGRSGSGEVCPSVGEGLLLKGSSSVSHAAARLGGFLRRTRAVLKSHWSSYILGLCPIAGYAAYVLLAGLSAGSAAAAFEIQGAWGRRAGFGGFLESLRRMFALEGFPPDVVSAWLGLLLLPLLFRRLPVPMALYGTGSVLLPLATGTPMSMGRFLSVSFPFFLAVGASLGERPRVLGAFVVAGACGQLWLLRRLAAWQFSG